MYINQLILHGCSNALHLELDFDPGGIVLSTRTSKGKFDQTASSPLDIFADDSYYMLYMLSGNDWSRDALKKSVSNIARTRSNPSVWPLLRQGSLTMLDLEQVFFDPSKLEFEDMEVFFSQGLDYFLDNLADAIQIGFATAVQADPYSGTLHHDTRLMYRDSRGMWYVVFWGVTPQLEQVFLPQRSAFPEMPPMIAPYLASLL